MNSAVFSHRLGRTSAQVVQKYSKVSILYWNTAWIVAPFFQADHFAGGEGGAEIEETACGAYWLPGGPEVRFDKALAHGICPESDPYFNQTV
jgi:hypothetical protein